MNNRDKEEDDLCSTKGFVCHPIGFTLSLGNKMHYCRTPVFGLGLGVEFTFAWDNNNNNDNDKNPHLNFLKERVLGDKKQGIR